MNQKKIKLLIGAIVVLIIASVVIMFREDILNLTNFFENENIQKEDDVIPENVTTIDTEIPDVDKGRIRLESEFSQYEFVVNSPKKLVDLLYSWGLYDRKYDLKEFGKNKGGVDEIVFIINQNPVKQSYMGISKYWGESSVEIQAEDNRLIVKISFTEKAFPQIKGYISKQALYGLYLISHPPIPNAKDVIVVEEKISRIIDEIEKEGLLFNIAQKPE